MTWQSDFPVYQIDFAVAAAGKRVASTKRRIQWYAFVIGITCSSSYAISFLTFVLCRFFFTSLFDDHLC